MYYSGNIIIFRSSETWNNWLCCHHGGYLQYGEGRLLDAGNNLNTLQFSTTQKNRHLQLKYKENSGISEVFFSWSSHLFCCRKRLLCLLISSRHRKNWIAIAWCGHCVLLLMMRLSTKLGNLFVEYMACSMSSTLR